MGNLCPKCQRKIWLSESQLAIHIERCGPPLHYCPKCHGSLHRTVKAEDRMVVVECSREGCGYSLEIVAGRRK
jgi:ssDNA-binding Zn-finger/Zn-ribbon topoisomerase 1